MIVAIILIIILGANSNFSLTYLQWVNISNGAVIKTINACSGPASQTNYALSFQIAADPANPSGPGLAIANCQFTYVIIDLRTWTHVKVIPVAKSNPSVSVTQRHVALLEVDNYGTPHQNIYTVHVFDLLTKDIVASKSYSYPDTFLYWPNYFDSDGNGSIFLLIVRYDNNAQQTWVGSKLLMSTFNSTSNTIVDGGSWDTTEFYITWFAFITNNQLYMWSVGDTESDQNLIKIRYSTDPLQIPAFPHRQ